MGDKFNTSLFVCNILEMQSLFQCDFESGSDSVCGMNQRMDDDFDWTRKSGPTPYKGPSKKKRNSGPDGAASGDWYIYIEVVWPVEENDVAL